MRIDIAERVALSFPPRFLPTAVIARTNIHADTRIGEIKFYALALGQKLFHTPFLVY